MRWGILATGKISHAFAAAVRDTADASLGAVASRDANNARRFADEFGGTPHGSYAALAADPNIDIVYIGTPHPMHAENALMMLEAGKAVLLEKPFTLNLQQAERVIAKAREKNLFVMEAMWTRCLPVMDAIRDVIHSGEIGTVRHISSHLGFKAGFGNEHRVYNPHLGGGALLDIGIYPLSIATDLLGPIESARAIAEKGPTGVDVQTAFSIRHKNGGISAGTCTFLANTPNEMIITGTKGHIRTDAPFHKAQGFIVSLDDGSKRRVEAPYLGNGYVHEAIEAGRCLRAGLIESPRMTHAQTLELMATMDDMRAEFGLTYPGE